MRKSRKIVAILATLALLATMLVPMATPALAAASYSSVTVPAVTGGNDISPLGTFRISVPAAELNPGDFVLIRLPNDYKFFPRNYNRPADLAVTNVAPAGNHHGQIVVEAAVAKGATAVGDDFVVFEAPLASNAINNGAGGDLTNLFSVTVTSDNELELRYSPTGGAAFNAGEDTAVIYVRMPRVFVPSGQSGEVKLTFKGQSNTAFGDGYVTVGKVGTGVVSIAVDDVKTITSTGGNLATLYVEEDRPGALQAAGDSVKLKLQSGFTWAAAGTVTRKWGDGTLATAVDPADTSGRTLLLTATTSTEASYFTIDGLAINVDESIAKAGDVEVTISGKSSTKQSAVVVARYGDYGVKVSSMDTTKEVLAGAVDQEIGKFVIEEITPGSLVPGRTITLTLSGGAKWHDFAGNLAQQDIRIDQTNSDMQGVTLSAPVPVGTEGDQIKYTVTANNPTSKPAKIVFEKANVDVSAGAVAGDLKVIIGGTASAAGEVTVAKVVPPVTAEIVGSPTNVVIGGQNQPIADVIITENKAEAIDSDAGTNQIRLTFLAGIVPNPAGSVEVLEGDIVLDKSSLARGFYDDGRWYWCVNVKSTSSKPSKIKFSGLSINVQRDFMEGPVNLYIGGPAIVQTAAAGLFPGFTSVGKVVPANCVTPVPGEQKSKAEFVINSSTYKVNGAEKTMDVTPYIKDGRTYLPIRYVGESLGVTSENIIWDAPNQTATLLKGDKIVQVKIGSKSLVVNGVSIPMDVAAEITDGRTMLPYRFIAQAFGAKVGWDETTQTVTMEL